ncbi:HIG1 domain family member 1A, mitochondrial-like [Pomacea canaliculata]|uniref:HIG1 domain family member 1A, mitochondrial-like n=1 Tax=Pomacea canaliculata TaxID=400727 RepID=UPI000D73692A|nr:HIG1 domain family member 1A, mitochondrial-like [Pomacea canaliculata]
MTGENRSAINQYEEDQSAKLWRKMKEAPFVPLGIAGLLGAVTYGIVQYRNRGSMSTSVYIMRFRVFAQGMVVGAITIGVGINIFSNCGIVTSQNLTSFTSFLFFFEFIALRP